MLDRGAAVAGDGIGAAIGMAVAMPRGDDARIAADLPGARAVCSSHLPDADALGLQGRKQ